MRQDLREVVGELGGVQRTGLVWEKTKDSRFSEIGERELRMAAPMGTSGLEGERC